MWSRINISGNVFAMNWDVNMRESKFLVMLFDDQLWKEEVSKDAFIKRCGDYNPTLEFTDKSILRLIYKTLDLLTDTSLDVKRVINQSDLLGFQTKTIKLEKPYSGVPYKFELRLKLIENSDTIYKEVTRPLFCLTHDLLTKQQLLINIIKKKDVEINEYKMQGAQLTRKNVETRVFNEAHFKHECINNIQFEFDHLKSFIEATELTNSITARKDMHSDTEKTSHDVSASISSAWTSQVPTKPREMDESVETTVQEVTPLATGNGERDCKLRKVKKHQGRNKKLINL